ncbi:MAG: sensor histidine kinase, partial [Spirochaetales bacterium]|nr:sensor histidine kinase [Spirochaetales bacterium]
GNVIYSPTTEDGRTFNIHGSVLHNPDGTVSKLEIIQDMTELTTAHNHVETLLAEKEIILKEVHHRIKNNMLTIMGLLTFQEQSLTDKKVIDAFENTRNRVQSMMVLYDKLYRSSNYQTILIKEYLETILKEIISGFTYKENVKLKCDIENIQLDPGKVFNLGIIINELITNSMKYAVNDSKNISIYVSVRVKKELIIFTIKDNGNGFPDTGTISNSGGFGLELVKILSNQISAEISLSNDNGAKVILKMKNTPGIK